MQYFRDTETGALFAFDDDVAAIHGDTGWTFFGPDDVALPGPYPATLKATDDITPPPYVLTLAELQAQRDTLLGTAAIRIAPLQDAVEIGEATAADEALLLAWKKYRVALNRLDLSTQPVAWPDPPAGVW